MLRTAIAVAIALLLATDISPPDIEIPTSHFRQGRTSPPFPPLSEALRGRWGRRCSGPPLFVL